MRRGWFLGAAMLTSGACRQARAPWSDASPHKVRFVTVATGVRLEVLDWGGAGPPLLFLSGLQDVAHGFDAFAPRFTDTYHVYAITRRGYGASTQTREGYDLATRVADDRAALDSLHLGAVSLVGHSMAGDELTGFATAYPARVHALVYLDAIYDHSTVGELFATPFPTPPMTASDSASPAGVQAYDLRAYGQHIPESQIRAIFRFDASGRLIGPVTPTVIDSQMLAGAGHPEYRRVKAAMLIICAIVDSMPQVFPAYATFDDSSKAQAHRFTEVVKQWGAAGRTLIKPLVPHAEWLEIPGANHYVFDSNGLEVETAMRRFLGDAQAAENEMRVR